MDEPVIEHGMLPPIIGGGRLVGIETLGAGTATGGLTPALLISNEPNGIPAGDTPLGDGGSARVVADEAALVEVMPHVAELASEDAPTPIPPPS